MQLEEEGLSGRELLGRLVGTEDDSEAGSGSLENDTVPHVDRSPKLNQAELLEQVQSQVPNLPLTYWQNMEKKLGANKTCALYPDIYNLHFSNKYWQETETSNGTFFFYGAYLDVRPNNKLGEAVRILAMINRLEPKVNMTCQIWFNDSKRPVMSSVLEYKYIWNKKWGNYKQGIFQPYLLTCRLPHSHHSKVPLSVSVVENMCDKATNNLKVIYNTLPPGVSKKKFAVCVKGLDFPDTDMSVRLVEWLELLAALGADKVFLYNLSVHPNVTKVLEYYTAKGLVDLTPLSLPGYQPNLSVLQHLFLHKKRSHKRQNELIPYNDCLYRNMYKYEYIALLDIDEVILPLRHSNWAEMMEAVLMAAKLAKNETRASWNFRNVYFMDEMLEQNQPDGFSHIPAYLHMFQHVYRSANYTKPGQYVKCFHNPEKVLILHNHFPLGCLGGACSTFPVDTELAHLQHYRQV